MRRRATALSLCIPAALLLSSTAPSIALPTTPGRRRLKVEYFELTGFAELRVEILKTEILKTRVRR